MHIAEEAARKFIAFIQQCETSRPDLDSALISYIAGWLVDGDGVEAVNSDFEVYTQTVLVIIDEWHKDPSLLDYRKNRTDGKLWTRRRRPPRIFRADDNRRGWVLDRSYFNSMVSAHRRR